ncbi:MAG: hypothetical protein JOS17DRAFT_761630 [Linnemannia elongata]|nr:MAG: hypothetical protein JOS17DRAFT_761630 [Linnemannia elongata]
MTVVPLMMMLFAVVLLRLELAVSSVERGLRRRVRVGMVVVVVMMVMVVVVWFLEKAWRQLIRMGLSVERRCGGCLWGEIGGLSSGGGRGRGRLRGRGGRLGCEGCCCGQRRSCAGEGLVLRMMRIMVRVVVLFVVHIVALCRVVLSFFVVLLWSQKK